MKKTLILAILFCCSLFLSVSASATIHTSTMNMQVGPCVFRVSVVYNDVTKHGSATITGTGPCANAGGSFHWLPVGPPTGPLQPVVDWNDLNAQYIVSGDINQIGQENVLAIFNEIAADPQY